MNPADATLRTLPATMIAGVERHDGHEVVFAAPDGDRAVSLGALVTDAQRVAGALQRRGIGPGDVVAVQLPGSYEGTVVQAAVILTGATLLPIVLIYGRRELAFILRQSGATAAVVTATHRGAAHPVLALAPDLPSLRTVVVVGGAAPDGALAFDALLGPLSGRYTAPDVAVDDRAMLVYTSGTTADPKGVQHSHRSLLAEVFSPVMMRDVGRGSRHLALFPPGHVAGLLGLMRILVHGTTTVVMQTWNPAHAAALVDAHELTYAVGAPIQLAGLLAEKARGAANLATLTEFMTGAAAVPPPLIRDADAAGLTAYRCYGSSEHPTITTGWIDDPLAKRATTDGRLIEGCEIRLLDDRGRDVPTGSSGEIVSRGPEQFIGYTDDALNADAFLPGRWFRTGDVGRLDPEGYLTITDRLKDIIIRGGENISSKEVEDILAEHPAVGEVAVLGLPDPELGERVCAVVVLRPDAPPLELEEVRAHFAAAGSARQKTPERVVVRTELPRTPAGKVQKFVLRAELERPPA